MTVTLSTKLQKASLLLRHTKDFQTDKLFPTVAFNHEQIQSSSTSGYLLTQKSALPRIASNLLSVNMTVLDDIIDCMNSSKKFIPVTSDEKKWSSVLNDLDLVSSEVDGTRELH